MRDEHGDPMDIILHEGGFLPSPAASCKCYTNRINHVSSSFFSSCASDFPFTWSLLGIKIGSIPRECHQWIRWFRHELSVCLFLSLSFSFLSLPGLLVKGQQSLTAIRRTRMILHRMSLFKSHVDTDGWMDLNLKTNVETVSRVILLFVKRMKIHSSSHQHSGACVEIIFPQISK